jgi:hypothetical protein
MFDFVFQDILSDLRTAVGRKQQYSLKRVGVLIIITIHVNLPQFPL